MIRILTIVFAGLLLTTSPSFAQSKETARAPQAQAGAPSARQLSLSRRYIELIQGEQMEEMVAEMIRSSAMTDANLRDMPQEDRDFLIELTTELTNDLMPAMFDQLVPVYARAFTEQELEALVAFFDTDVGRSISAKLIETMPEANTAMMTVIPPMMEKMFARLCAHYGCTEEERAMLSEQLGLTPPVVVRPSGK